MALVDSTRYGNRLQLDTATGNVLVRDRDLYQRLTGTDPEPASLAAIKAQADELERRLDEHDRRRGRGRGSAEAEIQAEALKLRAADSGLTYERAYTLVLEQNPELYQKHLTEQREAGTVNLRRAERAIALAAAKVRAEDPKLTEEQAVDLALQRDPSLYTAYRNAAIGAEDPQVQSLVADAEAEILNLAAAKRAANPRLSEADALGEALAERPDLYEAHRRNAPVVGAR